jgi:hypothetical protein
MYCLLQHEMLAGDNCDSAVMLMLYIGLWFTKLDIWICTYEFIDLVAFLSATLPPI